MLFLAHSRNGDNTCTTSTLTSSAGTTPLMRLCHATGVADRAPPSRVSASLAIAFPFGARTSGCAARTRISPRVWPSHEGLAALSQKVPTARAVPGLCLKAVRFGSCASCALFNVAWAAVAVGSLQVPMAGIGDPAPTRAIRHSRCAFPLPWLTGLTGPVAVAAAIT